jgi:hypothetical protein
MPNPTQRAQRAISGIAKRYGLALKNSKLADRHIRIHTLYGGGSRLEALLEDVEIAFAQCGAKGEFIALLPAEKLIQLLETEAVYDERNA